MTTLNLGCSDKEGTGNLSITEGYTGQNTFLSGDNKHIEKVKLKKLDDLVSKKLTCNDIIKIDVEGFEIKVLNGMKNILKNQNPVLIIEISYEKDKKEISYFLDKFNYKNTCILDGRNFVFKKKDRLNNQIFKS